MMSGCATTKSSRSSKKKQIRKKTNKNTIVSDKVEHKLMVFVVINFPVLQKFY